jgi:hypothetical protein
MNGRELIAASIDGALTSPIMKKQSCASEGDRNRRARGHHEAAVAFDKKHQAKVTITIRA